MKPQKERRRKRPREMVPTSVLFHHCCYWWLPLDSPSVLPSIEGLSCPPSTNRLLPWNHKAWPSQQPPFFHSACVSCSLPHTGTQVAERLLAWPCSWSVCWLGPPGSRCQDRVGSTSSLLQIMMLSCLVMSDSLILPDSSVHGIFPIRILEWVTISPSRRSSWLKDQMASPVLLCLLHGRWILYHFSSVQFSRSVMSDSLWPHELQHARPPCPSPTTGVHSNPCPSSWWCHPAISSSVLPFSSCPQSLPASVFSNESTLCMKWPKYWGFSFSIIPSKEHPGLISFRMDWLCLSKKKGRRSRQEDPSDHDPGLILGERRYRWKED